MTKNASKTFPKRSFRVKTFIFLTLLAILLLHLLSFVPILLDSIADYRSAKYVFFLNEISDNLYTAVGNLGFERGRVNVVLNDTGPVDEMEANRRFILARRADGDKALSAALSKLSAVHRISTENAIAKINQLTLEIEKLRRATSKDLVVPKEQRQQGMAEIWFAAMTDYIERIESLLVDISSDISDQDGMISRYSALKRETLALRNTAGPEMSILSATILSKAPLSAKLAKKITNLQVMTEGHFKNLRYLSQPLGESRIPQALQTLEKIYYDTYVPYRNIIFPLALKGGPYPYSQPEFLRPGVKALQQIASFMDIIVAVTKDYAEQKLNESRRQIIFHISLGVGSMALILLIFYFVHYRIIQPMSQVTSAVHRLAKKDLVVEVPQQNVQNEIGEMARAVQVFKEMAVQLDENVIALEKASAERERLISKLQATLNEIKVLRGILPICSICKKIRNDDGYYEQIESYIHKHSEADFSHTICPSCLKKHYPREYEKLRKDGEK